MDQSKEMILQTALAKALVDAVTPEMQKEVFKEAICEFLFRVDRDGKGALQDSFQRALNDATREIAVQMVHQPDILERIKQSVRTAIETALEDRTFIERIQKKLTGGYW
jgi:hypothetical protein